jgi:uncharacterized protein YndB with AHSA1/START domain
MTNDDSTLTIRRVFHADREMMIKIFTDPTIMCQWFFADGFLTAEVVNTFRVGGDYSIKMRDAAGNVILQNGVYHIIEPPEKLVFTWNSPMVKDTVVTVLFEARGDQTEVTLIHEFGEYAHLKSNHAEGWNSCLNHLEEYLQAQMNGDA